MRRFVLLAVGLALLAGVAVTVSGGATQAQPRWVITDLGTLGGPTSGVGQLNTYGMSVAGAINDRGQIVGWAETDRKDKNGLFVRTAFLWQEGKMRALPMESAVDINERGQVVGSIRPRNGDVAALWENGRVRSLGTLGGRYGEAVSINDRGQVAGNDTVGRDAEGSYIFHSFIWQNGKMTDLGALTPYSVVLKQAHSYTKVDAINGRGQIVGVSDIVVDGLEQTHGIVWANGKMTDLGSRLRTWDPATINDQGQIPGFVDRPQAAVWEHGAVRLLPNGPGVKGVRAVDINEAGTAVGVCIVSPSRRPHPCLWRDGKVQDLGVAFGDRGQALAVNERGQVIGITRDGARGQFHGFVWENGEMTDLGTLPGGKQSQALAISNRGQIIGWSRTPKGVKHAVLWTLKRG